jgi:hypothetical protein
LKKIEKNTTSRRKGLSDCRRQHSAPESVTLAYQFGAKRLFHFFGTIFFGGLLEQAISALSDIEAACEAEISHLSQVTNHQ